MKSSVIQESSSILCPHKHSDKSIYFCKNCAHNKKPIETIFFCVECNKTALNSHTHMNDRYPITHTSFKTMYEEFKSDFKDINKARTVDLILEMFP